MVDRDFRFQTCQRPGKSIFHRRVRRVAQGRTRGLDSKSRIQVINPLFSPCEAALSRPRCVKIIFDLVFRPVSPSNIHRKVNYRQNFFNGKLKTALFSGYSSEISPFFAFSRNFRSSSVSSAVSRRSGRFSRVRRSACSRRQRWTRP